MTHIVTLTTDFGLSDSYVGVMKGVILGLAPQVTVVDICHAVPRHDIAAASLVLAGAYRYFAPGTIHVAVVDPGVGTERRPLALEADGRFFVGPDNGLFSGVLARCRDSEVCAVHLTNSVFWLPSPSATFHGRDIFAPVAAHIALGVPLRNLGSDLAVRDLQRLPDVAPRQREGVIEGEVVYVDHFGNLTTNITLESLPRATSVAIEIAGRRISGVSTAYGDVTEGEVLALIGSTGFLEIAVSSGSASQRLGVGKGAPVRVRKGI